MEKCSQCISGYTRDVQPWYATCKRHRRHGTCLRLVKPDSGEQAPTHVLGRKGGTDWEEDDASSLCLGGAPFAPLRVVRVYDMVLQTFT